MMEGYFVISRRMLEDDMYLGERFSRGQAWIDLIGLAAFKDTATYVRKIRVVIARGCVAKSMHDLADRWQWDVHTVSRFLNHLQELEQIHMQKSNVTTLISIRNYEKYQLDAHADLHADAHTNAHANAHAPIIEKKINNNYDVDVNSACTCVRDENDEPIVLTDQWIEYIQLYVYREFKMKLKHDDVVTAFELFASKEMASGTKIYRQEFRQHFANWIRKKIEIKQQHNNGTANRTTDTTSRDERIINAAQAVIALADAESARGGFSIWDEGGWEM